MYWSYLTNNNLILTFESGSDLNKLIQGYCELLLDNYFSGFTQDFNTLFISEFAPDENPLQKDKKFIIRLDDINFALETLCIEQKKYH